MRTWWGFFAIVVIFMGLVFGFAIDRSFKRYQTSRPQMHSADGPIHRTEILSEPFEVKRYYRSMEGPWEKRAVAVAPQRDELVWIKGYQTEMVDLRGNKTVPQDFMCHLNVDFMWTEREKFFTEISRGPDRVVTLSPGLMRIQLPEGYGLPVHSKELVNFTMQVLNHHREGRHFIKHRVSIFYIPDSELTKPLTPVYPNSSFVATEISGSMPTNPMQRTTCTCCRPAAHADNAPQSHKTAIFQGEEGRSFTGHWIVPDGRSTATTPLGSLMNIHDGDPVVAAYPHVHPYAKRMTLYEYDQDCNRTEIFSMRAFSAPFVTGLYRIQGYFPETGLALRSTDQKELEIEYQNDSGRLQDSMASMFFFLEDTKFKKPSAVAHNVQPSEATQITRAETGTEFCGLPVPEGKGVSGVLSPPAK